MSEPRLTPGQRAQMRQRVTEAGLNYPAGNVSDYYVRWCWPGVSALLALLDAADELDALPKLRPYRDGEPAGKFAVRHAAWMTALFAWAEAAGCHKE